MDLAELGHDRFWAEGRGVKALVMVPEGTVVEGREFQGYIYEMSFKHNLLCQMESLN